MKHLHLVSPNLNFDFIKNSKPFTIFSLVFALASIALIFKPGLNYGIDFTGGALVQLKVPEGWDTTKLRSELEAGGVKEPSVVALGEAKDHEFLIKVQATPEELNKVSASVEAVMKSKAGDGNYTVKKVDVVGPAAGKTLRKSAFLSILYATLCISIYIAFRFDMRYAPGVLRALGVDVIATLGIWVMLGREFNLTVLASVLTVAGYSCNDTIVIYDRIREFTKTHPTWSLEQAINRSTNLNLSRTIVTVLCTCFVVVSLYIFGGPVLQDFALPMLLGFTISIPSTVFVATPLIIFMENRRLAREAAKGHYQHRAQKA